MRIVSLASGSAGNAYLVESQGAGLLIDCGISHRELKKRLESVGFQMDCICGAVFTHEHFDHVKGVETFHKRHPQVPLFANFMTAEAIEAVHPALGGAFGIFENGMPFSAGPFCVAGFSIPHDVCDPVGYVVKADGKVYFHATDIGSPLDSIGVKLSLADAATLESNHDPVLLETSDRAAPLKARIRGPRGHLCNADAAGLVRRFASPRLHHISLAHLSRECNEPHLAESAMRQTLAEIQRTDITLEILSQDRAGKVWEC